MEVDERPIEDYNDIGGLNKQIEELVEAVVLPMTHADKFKKLGIKPPKGVLMYGPPGTGKTLLARACAAQTKSTFLKLAGPQLVQVRMRACASWGGGVHEGMPHGIDVHRRRGQDGARCL